MIPPNDERANGEHCPALPFVAEILDRFATTYQGSHGLFVTAVDERGAHIDPAPVLPDYGDILPFLWACGRRELVEQQLSRAKPHLRHGLVVTGDRITALDNHDFLLGLVELAAMSGSQSFQDPAAATARELHRVFYRNGTAVCEVPVDGTGSRARLPRTSPFNAGYIELFVDLNRITGDTWFLEQARREAAVWISNPFFRRFGLFRRIEFADRPWLSSAARSLSRGPLVRLFKDNTNLVYALLALQSADPSERIETAILHWMGGFQARFLRDGGVPLHLDKHFRPEEPSLKAAFPVVDLLCDAHAVLPGNDEWLEWAMTVADFWMARQWPQGPFPLTPHGDQDHLDANTDMVVALNKLAERTGRNRYRAAASRCAEGILRLHRRPAGYVLSVDEAGKTGDGRVFVKYQGLLLKIELVWESPGLLYGNARLLSLLRDR